MSKIKITSSGTLLVVMALLLSACTVPNYNYAPQAHNISEPPLNTTVTVSVGDIMLRQGSYAEQDAIKLNNVIKIGLGSYTLHPGYYTKKGSSKDGSFYLPSGSTGSGDIKKGILSDPYQSLFVKNDKTTICVVTIFNVRACEKNTEITFTKIPSYTENSFQQTLLYLGRVGSKINIGYREFSNDTARPAFNNDVEYDLSESDIIAYKGAKLKINEATNQNIKYTVINNFNPD